MKDNLQTAINEASEKAQNILGSSIETVQVGELAEAILALCGALQIVSQEFRYYKKL